MPPRSGARSLGPCRPREGLVGRGPRSLARPGRHPRACRRPRPSPHEPWLAVYELVATVVAQDAAVGDESGEGVADGGSAELGEVADFALTQGGGSGGQDVLDA